MNLDHKDRQLLNLLQQNSKRTTKSLATELSLSVTAVFERIKKLERLEVIDGYVAMVNRKKIDRDFLVICHVKLIQHSKEFITQFEREISKFPEVLECFHVSGDYDYILKIIVKDISEYREFMVSKLTNLQHIASTQSAFTIKEVKTTTTVAL
ncbi:Lrp/AsnC family transcriptional regulator [Marnyiella aurantia]|uniref:Lrp/AsnC family transcriptional regulator n=1 Tax=Marnyiella aurantia TaxID=2758037 RepID=A0A7D7QZK3_9FLAO|nr:Lrp/AsnC family transcriptional regulator [Marnyiella aurantia]MBA5245661.1 Lrp/AsnC family transcriptional regulator [Marnyiella aurantia]MBP0613459.1 Lrp/AsnC family transcriptional regulator [Marnyiella aurantia]QMS98931.1 Lrp/AsnC family transcriptional regulator [Marnyiella aurantia]